MFRLSGRVLTTDWQWLIRLAWGKRRVSSRAKGNVSAYPKFVTAHLKVWASWILRNQILGRRGKIVVVEDTGAGHGARYQQELAVKEAIERHQKVKARMALKIDKLQEERLAARARKDFARADAIRAEIEQAGFKVNDAALAEIKGGFGGA